MKKKEDVLYKEIKKANKGVSEKEISEIIVWYDLFAYAITFLTMFLVCTAMNWNYVFTIFSIVVIWITEISLRKNLKKNVKGYKAVKNMLPMVKIVGFSVLVIAFISALTHFLV